MYGLRRAYAVKAASSRRSPKKKGRPGRRPHKTGNKDGDVKSPLRGLDDAGGGVPGDGDIAAEAGLVDHVASEGGVVAKDGVFSERLARFDRREESPEVRTDIVEVVATENVIFEERLL